MNVGQMVAHISLILMTSVRQFSAGPLQSILPSLRHSQRFRLRVEKKGKKVHVIRIAAKKEQ